MGIKEDKPGNNRKPFIFYYAIVMLVMMMVNLFLMPSMQQRKVMEVPYSTFLDMVEEGKVTSVGRNGQQLTFTAATGEKNILGEDEVKWYKTGLWPDENLAERLYEKGIMFSEEIVEPAPPLSLSS